MLDSVDPSSSIQGPYGADDLGPAASLLLGQRQLSLIRMPLQQDPAAIASRAQRAQSLSVIS